MSFMQTWIKKVSSLIYIKGKFVPFTCCC